MMRKFWPLLMAGSVGAMSVQAAPADIHEPVSYTHLRAHETVS